MAEARILVVEDEGIVAKDIRYILQSFGYEVVDVVSSGEAAVQTANEKQPDLVLMDIMLEGHMDGIEAAERIRSHLNIPVVYITAYADDGTIQRAKKTEPFGYIIKPFEERELRTIIEVSIYKHQMEKKLKEREEWLSTLLKSIGDAVIATDREGNVTFMNQVAEHLTGWKTAEANGKFVTDVFNIINEKTRRVAENPVARALREGRIVGLANHTVLISKEGTEVFVDDSASPIKDEKENIIGVVLVFRDITERRKAGEALARAKEDWENTVDSITDLVMMLDSEHRIVRVNKAAAKALGTTKSALVGKKCYEAIHKLNHPISRCPLVSTMKSLAPTTREITEPNIGGTFICSTAPVLDREGKLLGYTHTLKDITESRRLEAQFHQAQKMEAIGTLAGGIAHDFNNLLMAMQGYISLMLNDLDEKHPHHFRLTRVEDQIKSAAELTAQLMGFARGGKYYVKPLNLNSVIEKSLNMFGRARKEISISERYAEGLWTIEADQGQIEQVLLNLFVNAWQAMPSGGQLFIETRNMVLDKNCTKPHATRPGRYVEISVTDTGGGMDKATQARIFDPFFTTKEMGRGTGLGLASAYGIVKNHGGIIEVRSEKGRGTTFTINLPASEKEVAAEAEIKAIKEVVRGTETILLADDEEMIREVGRDLLEHMGYQVVLAGNGQEAIDIFREKRGEIDLIILDMIMPKMGGGETFDHIRKIDPNVKIVLSSGYSIDGRAAEILNRGCNDFIQKPFDMEKLSHKIRETLG